MVVFDLDPGTPATIIECAQIALSLRAIFEKYNLQSYPKTSGSKGLQIYLPLNTDTSYDQTKQFARHLAESLAEKYPNQVIANMKKELRAGKVLIDWSQNDIHKTTVCAYSLRAKESPFISTPVSWPEVEKALENKDPAILQYDSLQVIDRIGQHGDLFAPVLNLKQNFPHKKLTL